MSLVTTPAVLLRAYPFSESSRILRFYSQALGVVGVVARGVRKTEGQRGGSLSTFGEGALTLYVKEGRDLQTLKDFAPTTPRNGLARDPLRLAGASVLGELILQHAGGEENPGLFAALCQGLDAVEAESRDNLVVRLLMETWGLVRELGYGPVLRSCVTCGRGLEKEVLGRFDFAAGGLRCPACQEEGPSGPRLGPVARDQLAQLVAGEFRGELRRPRAHLRLVSDFVTYHISGGTPLRSISVLATLIPKDHA